MFEASISVDKIIAGFWSNGKKKILIIIGSERMFESTRVMPR